jgi:LuxR family transcriptional regulator, maltose regulon positive regulatory protein
MTSGTSVTIVASWVDHAQLADSAAFVQVLRDERDPQRFWLSVLTALRATSAGSRQIRELTPSPDLDDWAIVERLLADLAPLADRLWLVIDDVHELRSEEARKQVEPLVLRAPPELRIILATRHDVRLSVHRLRLEGGLTEIRADDLRFTLAEARELFRAGGLELTDSALAGLYESSMPGSDSISPRNRWETCHRLTEVRCFTGAGSPRLIAGPRGFGAGACAPPLDRCQP